MALPKYDIREFNPMDLERRRLNGSPPTIVVIGKRGTGKSTLIADLLFFMKEIPQLIVMSGTEEGNGFYKKYFHQLMIHNDYNEEIVNRLIDQQKTKLKACNKADIDPNTRPSLGSGLLLDDCGYRTNIMNKENIRLLFMNGRHFKILFIVSLQYMMGLHPSLRTNIDYVFCLRENIVDNQIKLYKYFFGCFKKFSHFQEVFNEFTNDYGCLVLDNTSKSNNVEDCVFFYKAVPNRKYKIGSPQLWRYLDTRYNPDFEEKRNDNKMNTVIIRKIRTPIH